MNDEQKKEKNRKTCKFSTSVTPNPIITIITIYTLFISTVILRYTIYRLTSSALSCQPAHRQSEPSEPLILPLTTPIPLDIWLPAIWMKGKYDGTGTSEFKIIVIILCVTTSHIHRNELLRGCCALYSIFDMIWFNNKYNWGFRQRAKYFFLSQWLFHSLLLNLFPAHFHITWRRKRRSWRRELISVCTT